MSIQDAMQMRVCLPVKMRGTVAEVIETVLNDNMINPERQGRKLPYNSFRSAVKECPTIDFCLEAPRQLSEVVGSLCDEFNLRITSRGDAIFLTD